MSVRKIEWTEIAIESLQECYDFLLITWKTQVADDFLSLVDHALELLKENPHTGKNVSNEFRRIILPPHSSLFYEMNEETITILLIWDNRQDPEKLKDNLSRL